jgi:hypothetical protein
MSSPIAQRFAARRVALYAMLGRVPEALRDRFPVSAERVRTTIEALDRRKAIEGFVKELAVAEKAAAMKYEWYYDGRAPAEWASGYTYGSCKRPLSYSGTDLVDAGKALGVESDVKLDDPLTGAGEIEIGRVLRAQHKITTKVSEYYLHMEAEKRVPAMTREQRLALPVLEDVYRNLFDLTLYELLHAACERVRERPDYVFVGTHERWPILVGAPPVRTRARRSGTGARRRAGTRARS